MKNMDLVMDWNSTYSDAEPEDEKDGPKVILRAEEVGIVLLVLMLWAGAVGLFIKSWGKIRMLEPYQPKFNDPTDPQSPIHPHRPSLSNVPESHSYIHPCRASRWHLPVIETSLLHPESSPRPYGRPRLNSVVVLTSEVALHRTANTRKVKSAADLTCTTLYEETDENLVAHTATAL